MPDFEKKSKPAPDENQDRLPDGTAGNTTPPAIIMPIRVAPQRSDPNPPPGKRRRVQHGVALAVALAALITGGAVLWHYLAGRPATQVETVEQVPAPDQAPLAKPSVPTVTAAPATQPASAELAAAKALADAKLAAYLKRKQPLDARGVAQWGGAVHDTMLRLAEEADQLLVKKQYAEAAAIYDRAAAQAAILTGRTKAVLEELLAAGQAALENGNGALARQKFTVALLIDSENESARHGLQRAQTIDTVRKLVETGARHEAAGNIALAHADFQQAHQTDPQYEPARTALARIKTRIKDAEFQQLMSTGLTALHQGDYQTARRKLQQARQFKPASGEVKDALAQVDQAMRLARIATYRQQAFAAEKTENWRKASQAYAGALKLDANLHFAVQGQARALNRIRMAKRIDFFLQHPAALESDRQLANAVALVAEIEQITPRGPKLNTRLTKLARLVTAAQTPVRVIIESDTFTEVAIYKVGRLGRFASRELRLRPGTYTVVGTRDGYQDVRRRVILKTGQNLVRVPIRCEVEI